MAGFLKAILIAIIAVASIIVFVNLAFFFPWYMEVIQTTLEISQVVSTDNYLAYDYYRDTLNDLKDKPIFNDRKDNVIIEAIHEGGKDAIERDGPFDVHTHYYPLALEKDKPYVQMGNLVTVTVRATYPFRMQMFGKPIAAADIPLSFSMTTVTTRHYKDLEFEFGPDRFTSEEFYDYE